jgi:hypothetical protein
MILTKRVEQFTVKKVEEGRCDSKVSRKFSTNKFYRVTIVDKLREPLLCPNRIDVTGAKSDALRIKHAKTHLSSFPRSIGISSPYN